MIKHKEGLKESFTLYKGLNGTLSSVLCRRIIKSYYSKVIDKIIFDNLEYKFKDIGSVYIGKVKPKLHTWEDGSLKPTLPVDWVSTKKYGKIIYHMNDNRYGYVFRIKWDRAKTKQSTMFKFYPERYHFKRYLSSILMDEDVRIDAPELSNAYNTNRT